MSGPDDAAGGAVTAMPRRAPDTSNRQADPDLACAVRGWEPAVDMASGRQGLDDFVGAHADRYRPAAD